jgi:hypothetical protein
MFLLLETSAGLPGSRCFVQLLFFASRPAGAVAVAFPDITCNCRVAVPSCLLQLLFRGAAYCSCCSAELFQAADCSCYYELLFRAAYCSCCYKLLIATAVPRSCSGLLIVADVVSCCSELLVAAVVLSCFLQLLFRWSWCSELLIAADVRVVAPSCLLQLLFRGVLRGGADHMQVNINGATSFSYCIFFFELLIAVVPSCCRMELLIAAVPSCCCCSSEQLLFRFVYCRLMFRASYCWLAVGCC